MKARASSDASSATDAADGSDVEQTRAPAPPPAICRDAGCAAASPPPQPAARRSRVYSPPSLVQLCLDAAGARPEACLLGGQQLWGLGEDLLAHVLLAVIRRGNLTVPLVKALEACARDEGHESILAFVEGLDMFAVAGMTHKYAP